MSRIAFVTGAGSGIGRACALRLVEEGASIAVADIDRAGAEETAHMVEARGGRSIALEIDVGAPETVERSVVAAVGHFGQLDWAINNAGVDTKPGAGDWDEDVWERMLSINLRGVARCMRHEVAQMRANGGGAIVNMSSIGGMIGAGSMSYSASKQGIVGLTRVAAIQFAAENVRVNAICPGMIMTPMAERALQELPDLLEGKLTSIPMRRGGRPEEVAEAAVWLCSDRSSYVTAQVITVDGGLTAS